MSTYSLASRLIWKKGFCILRPIILSSCSHDLQSVQREIINSAGVIIIDWNSLVGNPTSCYRSFSTSSNRNGDKDDDKDQGDSSNPNVKYDPKEDSFFTQDVAYGSKDNKGLGEGERPYVDVEKDLKSLEEDDLIPPIDCCQSGCPNCVWLEYVEKLTQRYMNPELGREKILKDLETIENQSIKAFIMLELRSKGLL